MKQSFAPIKKPPLPEWKRAAAFIDRGTERRDLAVFLTAGQGKPELTQFVHFLLSE